MPKLFPTDHADAIRAKSKADGSVVFTAPLNADGTLSIVRNGLTLYRRVLPGRGFSPTDRSPGDVVIVFDAAGQVAVGDFQSLLDSLK